MLNAQEVISRFNTMTHILPASLNALLYAFFLSNSYLSTVFFCLAVKLKSDLCWPLFLAGLGFWSGFFPRAGKSETRDLFFDST